MYNCVTKVYKSKLKLFYPLGTAEATPYYSDYLGHVVLTCILFRELASIISFYH